MTYYAWPFGFQILDNNAKPAAGAKVYSYQAGSSIINEPTYAIPTGVPNNNPVIADGNGRVSIFVDPNIIYHFIVKSADGAVTYLDEDNIQVYPGLAATGSGGNTANPIFVYNMTSQSIANVPTVTFATTPQASSSVDQTATGFSLSTSTGNVATVSCNLPTNYTTDWFQVVVNTTIYAQAAGSGNWLDNYETQYGTQIEETSQNTIIYYPRNSTGDGNANGLNTLSWTDNYIVSGSATSGTITINPWIFNTGEGQYLNLIFYTQVSVVSTTLLAGGGGGTVSPLTTNGDIYIYNGGNARLPIGSEGQTLKVSSGLPAWGAATNSFYSQPTPPASPVPGDRWVRTTTGIEYTYFNDGSGSQWVELNSGVASAIAGGSSGQVVVQTGNTTTGFTAAGTAGQVLTSAGAGTPVWTNLPSFGPTTQLTGNGWAKFGTGGLIIQWGTANSSGSSNILFPIHFPTACLNVNTSSQWGQGGSIDTSSITTTGFTASTWDNNGSLQNYAFSYIAIGY